MYSRTKRLTIPLAVAAAAVLVAPAWADVCGPISCAFGLTGGSSIIPSLSTSGNGLMGLINPIPTTTSPIIPLTTFTPVTVDGGFGVQSYSSVLPQATVLPQVTSVFADPPSTYSPFGPSLTDNPFLNTLSGTQFGSSQTVVSDLSSSGGMTPLSFVPFGSLGNFGSLGVVMPSVASVAAVPGPVMGAGLPGLLAACAGLIALARRRRQQST